MTDQCVSGLGDEVAAQTPLHSRHKAGGGRGTGGAHTNSAPKQWQGAKGYYLRMAASEKCQHDLWSLVDVAPFAFPGIASGIEKVLRSKISLWRGDITKLGVDAVVNAANNRMLGGGGVDGAIHAAAGRLLKEECRELHGCPTGKAKITGAYMLPAKYVIHTVGPMDGDPSMLQSCYEASLDLVLQHKLKSVAFPCIATLKYRFPNEAAARIALETTRRWLLQDSNYKKVDRVIFCVFLPIDWNIYFSLLPSYFPAAQLPALAGTTGQGQTAGPVHQI